MEKIDNLNNDATILINDFKEFCSEIKTKVDNGELFSYLYPDFFNYMYDEIAVYGRDLERIMSKKDYTEFYLNEFVVNEVPKVFFLLFLSIILKSYYLSNF